ncbi:MAG: calcium-binding protein [Cyanobacteria bacterium P01_A01_bin.135]
MFAIPTPTDGLGQLIDGTSGEDTLEGSTHNDTINGLGGDDSLYGGDGNDDMFGSAGDDRLFGQDGADSLNGGLGYDTLIGADGNDTLIGGTGSDLLIGGQGDDQLIDYSGLDTLVGSSGADEFRLTHSSIFSFHSGGYFSTYATIQDFDHLEGDKIFLRGSASDYTIIDDDDNAIIAYSGKGSTMTAVVIGGAGNSLVMDRDIAFV